MTHVSSLGGGRLDLYKQDLQNLWVLVGNDKR
jgi:hypothetical protein